MEVLTPGSPIGQCFDQCLHLVYKRTYACEQKGKQLFFVVFQANKSQLTMLTWTLHLDNKFT